MFVGVLRLTFHVPHARSLKDKRRVVLKFRDRVIERHLFFKKSFRIGQHERAGIRPTGEFVQAHSLLAQAFR